MNLNDIEAGQRDGKTGVYDKWYRYNRADDGEAYDIGIALAMKHGAEIEHFIEVNNK